MNNKPLSEEERAYAEKIIKRFDDEMYFKSIELRHFINQISSVTSEIERLTTEKMRYTELLAEEDKWNTQKSTTEQTEKEQG